MMIKNILKCFVLVLNSFMYQAYLLDNFHLNKFKKLITLAIIKLISINFSAMYKLEILH